ncbi:unnamed protein product [Paramecium sonneborni]|uniref:Uncharacterized protein n=1 Tax=Paramecium sonneborni TaxID=65129 RepID=A0A8S1PGN3_9CILI|nr:unnamed protein product [Paramecium sonneborni]
MIIKGKIIKTQQPIQFQISQSIKHTGQPEKAKISVMSIKQFLKEVDIDDEFYENPSNLKQAAYQYSFAIGFNLNYNLTNAKQWLSSKELIELTYVLKWIYDVSSDEEKENIDIIFDPKDDVLKNIVLLNIALEQKKLTFMPPYLVNDKCEIIYGLSLIIQKKIENDNIDQFIPLLQEMEKKSSSSRINQIIVLELFDIVLSKLSGDPQDLFNKLISNNHIINLQIWEQEQNDFIEQELEMPYFYLRQTKKVYQNTKEGYEMTINEFKSKWEKYISKQKLDLFDLPEQNEKIDPQELEAQIPEKADETKSEIKKSTRPKSRINKKKLLDSTIQKEIPSASDQKQIPLQDSLSESTKEIVPPLPPPPPPPPPRLLMQNGNPKPNQAPNYSKFCFNPIEKNIDMSIWTVQLQDFEIQVNHDILKYFIKKERQQQQKVVEIKKVQKDIIEVMPSVFKEEEMGIELLQKTLSKVDLDILLDQINELKFLDKNQDIQIISIIEDLNNQLKKITKKKDLEKSIKDIQQTIQKAKTDNEQYAKKKQEEENNQEIQEIQRLKNLQGIEKEEALLEFDQSLNTLQNDLNSEIGEKVVQQLIEEQEKTLKQLRTDLENTYLKKPEQIIKVDDKISKQEQNNLELQEKKKDILQQFESALLQKQQRLKSIKPPRQDKFKVHPNDLFIKKIYDKNPRNGIQIEAFQKEYRDRKIHISNTVTQNREILSELSRDKELIMYFQYIKQYGKIFNEIKSDKYGYQFENILTFSYKTQQLEGNQEELIKYIVQSMLNYNTILKLVNNMVIQKKSYEELEEAITQKMSDLNMNKGPKIFAKLKTMIKERMPLEKLEIEIDKMMLFKNLEETPYKHLYVLSQKNRALSEIKDIITLFKEHQTWLEKYLKQLSENQDNIMFVEKAQKYAKEYKEFIFQMEIIYNTDSKNLQEIRYFFSDFRDKIESPQFFQDILTIKTLLRNYQYVIEEEMKKTRLQMLKASKKS